MVTVVDAFGIPVPAAFVEYFSYSQQQGASGRADAEGRLTLDAPAGSGEITAGAAGFGATTDLLDLVRDSRVERRLTLAPQRSVAFAVLGAEVVPGSVTPDGRELELRVAVSGDAQLLPWSFELDPCVPRFDGELAALGPACLDKGDGTDQGWHYVGEVEVGAFTTKIGDPAGPVLVLLDRSQYAGEIDAPDVYLFAAKGLVANLLGEHPIAVGAFAGDGGPSGTASLLPDKPVTFYPVDHPSWISDRVVAFEALESVRGRMGGTPALAAAIESGIDFLEARTEPSDRPALVVLTAGGSEGCSFDEAPGPIAMSQCIAIREAVERAQQAGMALWLIGPGDALYASQTSFSSPGSLVSVASAAPVRWAAATVEGAASTAAELVRAALAGTPEVREVRFRVTADQAGAFSPGDEIRGVLRMVDGGMGYWTQRMPFRAKVSAG